MQGCAKKLSQGKVRLIYLQSWTSISTDFGFAQVWVRSHLSLKLSLNIDADFAQVCTNMKHCIKRFSPHRHGKVGLKVSCQTSLFVPPENFTVKQYWLSFLKFYFWRNCYKKKSPTNCDKQREKKSHKMSRVEDKQFASEADSQFQRCQNWKCIFANPKIPSISLFSLF